jgi:hypothetical protein
MARKTNTTTAAPADLSFFSNLGAKTGELTTASTANANLFYDGFLAGYHGSKKAHAGQRELMRQLLIQKYNL